MYGGRIGINLGSSLPCFSCPFVSGCAGHCYLMVLQRSYVGFQTGFEIIFSTAFVNILWPFVLFLIFHVLKGCHPYDMEAGILENQLKQRGIRFLKIETDYVKEDEQNIVTRLEAFKQTLRSRPS